MKTKTLIFFILVFAGIAFAKDKQAAEQPRYELGILRDHSEASQVGLHDGVYCVGFEYRDCYGDWSPIYSVHRDTLLITADGVKHALLWKTKYWGASISAEASRKMSVDGLPVSYRIDGKHVFILTPGNDATGEPSREIKFDLRLGHGARGRRIVQ